VEKIFKFQKLKKEHCKNKKCKKREKQDGKKLKEKLQEENKKTSNGPRFRSAKKGKYSKYDVCYSYLTVILLN
jgi:hypothetical protein